MSLLSTVTKESQCKTKEIEKKITSLLERGWPWRENKQ